MDFTKLSEVEALEEVPEGASVLAEVNGVIKRIPGEGLGGGDLVVFTIEADDAGSATGSCSVSFEECIEIIAERGAAAFIVKLRDPEMVSDVCVGSITPLDASSNPVGDYSLAEMLGIQTFDFGFLFDKSGAISMG